MFSTLLIVGYGVSQSLTTFSNTFSMQSQRVLLRFCNVKHLGADVETWGGTT